MQEGKIMSFTEFFGGNAKCNCPFCEESVEDLVAAMHEQTSSLGIVKALQIYMNQVDPGPLDELVAGLLATVIYFLSQGDATNAQILLDGLMESVQRMIAESN
jgi:hypothetical protein